MNKIKDFVKKLSDKEYSFIDDVEKVDNEYFLVSKEVKTFRDKIKLKPYSQGISLGRIVKGVFVPSLPLLDLVKTMDNSLRINEKGEQMFLYHRDVFEENFLTKRRGMVIVVNKDKEVLGLGEVKGKILKPVIDRGDYLRRER